MKKGTLPLVAILFAVIILGGAVFISASPVTSDPFELHDQDALTTAVAAGLLGGERSTEWMRSLDKVIPPEERERLIKTDRSELTVAKRFTRDFLIRLSEDGNAVDVSFSDIDMSIYETFVDEFIEKESDLILSKVDLFKKDDLETIIGPSKEEVRRYGNNVGEVILNNSTVAEHELHIFKRLMKEGNRSDELALIKMSSEYIGIAKDASLVEVPDDAVDIHLDFINNMIRGGAYIEKMASVTEDPVEAVLSFNMYMEMTGKSFETMKRVYEYFDYKEIFYEEDESGFAFTILKHIDVEKELQEFLEKQP